MQTFSVQTRTDLQVRGMSRTAIDQAVARGALIRARRGCYLEAGTPAAIVQAVRIGGRLTCLSVLVMHGVFVQRKARVHVHMPRSATRMRAAYDRSIPLASRQKRLQVLHWLALRQEVASDAACVGILDALIHSIGCQSKRQAVASIDSALHLELVTLDELTAAFETLPKRYRELLALVDGRAESGPESLMRLMVRELGCQVELQVEIDGVGRVDLVVDGWLVIECDSKAHHDSWEQQEKDRERDLALAVRGYTSIRPTASHIMNRPGFVRAAVKGLLRTH